MKEKFNMPETDYNRMAEPANVAEVDPASKSKPIKEGETLEPSLRGLEKIKKDPDLRRIVVKAIS